MFFFRFIRLPPVVFFSIIKPTQAIDLTPFSPQTHVSHKAPFVRIGSYYDRTYHSPKPHSTMTYSLSIPNTLIVELLSYGLTHYLTNIIVMAVQAKPAARCRYSQFAVAPKSRPQITWHIVSSCHHSYCYPVTASTTAAATEAAAAAAAAVTDMF